RQTEAHTHPGDDSHRHPAQLADHDEPHAALGAVAEHATAGRSFLWLRRRLTAVAQAGESLVQRITRHLRDAERREQLANDGVGLHLAAFERVDVRADFLVHELAHGIAHGEVDIRPLDHAIRLPYRDRAPDAAPPTRRWCAPATRRGRAASCAAARSASTSRVGRWAVP